MTDRFNTLTVSLDRDIRDEDAETIINLIRRIRGVNGVTGNVVDTDSYAATSRVTTEITNKLFDFIQELNKR